MDNQSKYIQAVKAITQVQSGIVGDNLAMRLANQVDGLKVENMDVKISGNPVSVLDALVHKYSILFGQVSIDVSRDAIKRSQLQFADNELPEILNS